MLMLYLDGCHLVVYKYLNSRKVLIFMTLRTWNRISLKEIWQSDTIFQILFDKWRRQLLFAKDLQN
jgi:hypothetical protein